MLVDQKNIIPALIIGFGIALGGYFIGQTIIKAKKFDRYVTVKGLSEREVMADLAIWPIQITIAGNELDQLERQLLDQTSSLTSFLKENNIDDSEITTGSPNIQDTRANFYGGPSGSPYRYIIQRDFTIRTTDIEKLHRTVALIPSIIGKGIILGSKNQWQQIEYLYTKLNDIKPGMIEEATINAREAAEKFARDSKSEVGKIKTASQGFFSIQDRDINTGHIKKVRVVNTIQFYLKD
jgi:hypothetical protein